MDDDARGWKELGLYDPAAANAEDRLATLRFLRARGATDEDLQDAVVHGRLPDLAGELQRHHRRRISAQEIAARTGVPVDTIRRVSRAAGQPAASDDEPVFVEQDAETFRAAAAAAELFGLDSTLQFARVAGSALANIADAALTNFGQTIGLHLHADDAGELARVQAIETATLLLFDEVPGVLASLFFHQCETAMRRVATAGAAETSDLTVGFLDLVGSTALAERVSPAELGGLINDFEREAVERVVGCDGRIVKTLGDEVMLVTTDAVGACHVALELATWVESHPMLPRLRGALAAGGLVRGYGDYYGPVVNTAARAVKLAEPGTVLVTDELRQRADSPGLAFEPLGDHALRGFARPVELFRVRAS